MVFGMKPYEAFSIFDFNFSLDFWKFWWKMNKKYKIKGIAFKNFKEIQYMYYIYKRMEINYDIENEPYWKIKDVLKKWGDGKVSKFLPNFTLKEYND